jgi:gamma-glutamylcyclotransferase (GGCT)/AIG2-like uncharacterized protein YtfP
MSQCLVKFLNKLWTSSSLTAHRIGDSAIVISLLRTEAPISGVFSSPGRSDSIQGTVFEVTGEELKQADAYEPKGYERILVQLKSGINAWVYLASERS